MFSAALNQLKVGTRGIRKGTGQHGTTDRFLRTTTANSSQAKLLPPIISSLTLQTAQDKQNCVYLARRKVEVQNGYTCLTQVHRDKTGFQRQV